MREEDIARLLRAQPFEPFRFYLSDGQIFDVPHHDFAHVSRSQLVLTLDGDGGVPRLIFCSLLHITRIEVPPLDLSGKEPAAAMHPKP